MLEYLTGIRETDTSIYKLDNIVQFVCAVVCVFVCVYAEASLRVQFGGCSINGDCLCILCNVICRGESTRAIWWLLNQRRLPLHLLRSPFLKYVLPRTIKDGNEYIITHLKSCRSQIILGLCASVHKTKTILH